MTAASTAGYNFRAQAALTHSARKCRKAQKQRGFRAKSTYGHCIKDEVLIDPACGTGGMLIEAIRHIDNDHMTYGKIYGQEKNLSTSAIARMNLFLHGAREFKIVQGDTLVDPSFTEGNYLKTFDCVLANPPFSLKHWGAAAFEHDKYGRNIWGSPSDSNADFAWLQHMVASMDKKHGRVAVVLPQGVLFRTGKDGKMRKKLVDSDLLEAVITLKGGIFYGAGVSACILFLKREKSKFELQYVKRNVKEMITCSQKKIQLNR